MAIEVTAGAVVYRHGQAGIEYLLLQSMNKGNFWGFPKGHVEAGESLVETATREIKEEISLQVAVDTSFSVYTEYDLPNGNRKQMTLYLADLIKRPASTCRPKKLKTPAGLITKRRGKG